MDESAPRTAEQAEEAEPDLPLVDFGVVVGGKARFDVCRLFLASLQLVSGIAEWHCRHSAGDCCHRTSQEGERYFGETYSVPCDYHFHRADQSRDPFRADRYGFYDRRLSVIYTILRMLNESMKSHKLTAVTNILLRELLSC